MSGGGKKAQLRVQVVEVVKICLVGVHWKHWSGSVGFVCVCFCAFTREEGSRYSPHGVSSSNKRNRSEGHNGGGKWSWSLLETYRATSERL